MTARAPAPGPFPVPRTWTRHPSPHHGARPAGAAGRITAVILHADASSSVGGTLRWLADPASKVSYHVLVGRTGSVHLVVDPARRAWHAGASALDGRAHCNDFTVGVCLANRNDGVEAYPEAQLAAAADVVARLCRHYGVPVAAITTHALTATPAGRKTDPRGLDLPAFRTRVARQLSPPHSTR